MGGRECAKLSPKRGSVSVKLSTVLRVISIMDTIPGTPIAVTTTSTAISAGSTFLVTPLGSLMPCFLNFFSSFFSFFSTFFTCFVFLRSTLFSLLPSFLIFLCSVFSSLFMCRSSLFILLVSFASLLFAFLISFLTRLVMVLALR